MINNNNIKNNQEEKVQILSMLKVQL